MTTAYKVVRRLRDGRLVSSFVDDISLWPHVTHLTYEYGKITIQHEDSKAGIFCHRTLETAVKGHNISKHRICSAEVREVYPIGEEIPFWLGGETNKRLVNYPAVLVGRKVADIDVR